MCVLLKLILKKKNLFSLINFLSACTKDTFSPLLTLWTAVEFESIALLLDLKTVVSQTALHTTAEDLSEVALASAALWF